MNSIGIPSQQDFEEGTSEGTLSSAAIFSQQALADSPTEHEQARVSLSENAKYPVCSKLYQLCTCNIFIFFINNAYHLALKPLSIFAIRYA